MTENLQRPPAAGGSKVGMFIVVVLMTAGVGTAFAWFANGGGGSWLGPAISPNWRPQEPPSWRPTTKGINPAAFQHTSPPPVNVNRPPKVEIRHVGNQRITTVTTYRARK